MRRSGGAPLCCLGLNSKLALSHVGSLSKPVSGVSARKIGHDWLNAEWFDGVVLCLAEFDIPYGFDCLKTD